jgi:hypothetical protein
LFENFTDSARRSVVLAENEARSLNDAFVGTEHILLGLIQEGEGAAARALASLRVSYEITRSRVAKINGRGPQGPGRRLPLTPRTLKILEISLQEARRLGRESVSTEHLLLALIEEGGGVGVHVLELMGVRLDAARMRVLKEANFNERESDMAGSLSIAGPGPPERIFLCHSSGDKQQVRILYQRLLQDGLWPWLDEIDISPGRNWEMEIRQAIRSSRHILVCLSKGSITKRGYVQKEIKQALDVADEQPDGTIFLIPVRLEDCKVPSRLGAWQWGRPVYAEWLWATTCLVGTEPAVSIQPCAECSRL